MAIVAICPYFKKCEGKKAVCEICSFNFKDSKMRNEHLNQYCASYDYKNCTVCKLNDAYYSRKDKDLVYENEYEEII